ncbi:hypothetical protein QE152_g8724 [Popillia japonica]|uniref:Uncharacterized protein n=1 Tax=Popillia japonica TaxID=7064 RepID=A0AAW1M5A1_POPJA
MLTDVDTKTVMGKGQVKKNMQNIVNTGGEEESEMLTDVDTKTVMGKGQVKKNMQNIVNTGGEEDEKRKANACKNQKT